MKIVFISRLYLPHLGGVEIHLKEVSAVLARMGHEVCIITWQHDKKLSLTAEYQGVQVLRIPFEVQNDKQQTWNAIKKYSQLCIEADVIHVHDVFWWLLPLYAQIKNKIFITFHGWETKLPIPLNAKLHRLLANKLARGTIHVGDFIQKFYWDKPDAVIYGGINPKRFTKSNLKYENNKSTQLHFVFVGRLDADTDILLYLEFLRELQAKKIQYTITWVGDGELSTECRKFGEVTGFIKNISQYIAAADFVFASSYLSILEAQRLKKVVLAFYSNPLKKEYLETFPGSKYMLIAGSVQAMKGRLEHLMTTRKLRAQMEITAQQFAQTQTWDAVVEQYLQLWEKKGILQ